ncbi:anthranilate phosphoribosyltransferase [Galenea microaerophila]
MSAAHLKPALEQLLAREDLSKETMQQVMQALMSGQASDAQIGAILIALRMKGETPEEIASAAQVMRDLAAGVSIADKTHLVDTCGTGGDGANTFNVSTASAFVVAAAGGKVAKHGNRSISSKSGSADVLEAAGVNLNLTPEQVAQCVEEVGVGFMFAPAHHSAMKHVIGARKSLGVRTLFNLLGPLTNPAGAPAQVVGVYDEALLPVFAEVLQRLGAKHVMVVHAEDGLDEISIASPTKVAELKAGQITEWQIQPQILEKMHESLAPLAVNSAAESLALIEAVFNQKTDSRTEAAKDIIALNAGAALYVSGLASSFEAGVQQAETAIKSGAAADKLQQFVQFTQQF